MKLPCSLWGVHVLACTLALVVTGPVRAGWILVVHDPIIVFGEQVIVTKEVWAHARAVVNGPGGGSLEVSTHDGTTPAHAEFSVIQDGRTKAKSGAWANPVTQLTGTLWVVDETLGWNPWNGNGTEARIVKMITSTNSPGPDRRNHPRLAG